MRMHPSYQSIADENHLEIFHCPDDYVLESNADTGEYPDGWYWWSCSPGCLPNSDPIGAFDTEEEALYDAIEPFLY